MRFLQFILFFVFIGCAVIGYCSDTNHTQSSVTLCGDIGNAASSAEKRFLREPFDNLSWLRADLTFEMKRHFTNYSGDISGRFLELMAVMCQEHSVSADKIHPQYLPLLREIPKLQCSDGHFGDPNIDWNGTIDFGKSSPKYMPALWGNSRILCGLVESYKLTKDENILQSAVKLGDFYVNISRRLTDSQKVAEFTGVSAGEINEAIQNPAKRSNAAEKLDTYAAGYGTCFFPAAEGLVKLYQETKEKMYLETADKIVGFYAAFDMTRTNHTHGMLCTYYGGLLVSHETGNKAYLAQSEKRWDELTEGGFINPMGGIAEGIAEKSRPVDEGCSEAD
jgi:hypothetical protein